MLCIKNGILLCECVSYACSSHSIGFHCFFSTFAHIAICSSAIMYLMRHISFDTFLLGSWTYHAALGARKHTFFFNNKHIYIHTENLSTYIVYVNFSSFSSSWFFFYKKRWNSLFFLFTYHWLKNGWNSKWWFWY